MRYELVGEIVFTDINSKNTTIKDMREYEDQIIVASVNILDSRFIDEIATKEEFYGEASEFETYKIVDQNIIKLFEAEFDITKLRKLDIPQ